MLRSCTLVNYSLYLESFDPRGRPTDTAGSDHYFLQKSSVRPYVRTSPHFKTKQILSENNVRYWRDCGSG